MKGMIMNAKTLVPVIALLVSAGIVSAEMRTWTNIKGGTIEAEFIELKHSKVFLRTPDGQTRNIPKSKLIEEDQRLVDELSNPATQNSASAKVQAEASDEIEKVTMIRIMSNSSFRYFILPLLQCMLCFVYFYTLSLV